ncbi:PREDICTED: LOW QUALITY PROTEIN: dexamethasone-induced Ras-related protein 1-like [Apaloderma vittatum]|uniref:LOW QUALITY PROTEIN: dexamethasone-induced Ras-related protein 1-like n=1 Tax=Apaloderma vittatum TaxID=57397 RepID=UPI0005213A0E|nr:PREDICTED: LOW QUALITY PROTEIN: dexamethasone-induced Ras-related protein 1-like [Apaloderma vittatum]
MKLAAMIKKMCPSEAELSIPAKNCYRMVILGSSKVGKTAIVSRFLTGRFPEMFHQFQEEGSGILCVHGVHGRMGDPGDVFILVFSLDNRDSFEEVQRLKQQILETKSCLKNKTKENIEVPLVICGNKGDRDFYREVQPREIEQLVGGDPKKCAYFEISAKKNSSLDQMFQALFAMAKLPSEMSPDLHRKVSVQYCDILHKKALKGKKLLKEGGRGSTEEAYGVVAPSLRGRPSVHSDLMYIREKAIGGGHGKEKDRCVIS